MGDLGRVFITGATGFIGGHLARRLVLSEGAQVVILARDPSKASGLSALGVEVIQGDITEPESWCNGLIDCQVVYHCAAWVSESGPIDQVWAVNVYGTQNVVEAAVNARVDRFVHLSTCGVYGSKQAFDIDENTSLLLSGSRYKDSKIAAEKAVFQAYRDFGLPVVAARASQVYGPESSSSPSARWRR